MCGIAAILGRMRAGAVASSLQAMLHAQAHRGPDDQGLLVTQLPTGVLGMGNRRLSIQDPSPLGHQPMKNPDTGDILVYNGEIYNAPELRELLQRENHIFRSHSDTEVLLRAYERWGVDCLDRMRGMFAFALWDASRARLLLSRDHAGMKPLYYSQQGDILLCASEVRALVSSGLMSGDVDRRALAGYLAYGGVQEPFTIVEGVVALPGGCWREFDSDGEQVGEGWHWTPPAVADSCRSLTDVVEEGRSLLQQSVTRHLLSDVRVGIFLSSGLDSTALLGLAAKSGAPPNQLDAFTVGFPGTPAHDETEIARITAAGFGVAHCDSAVDSATVHQWVLDALDCMDQPSMDGFNTYIVSRAIRQHGIKVALSGVGADELFGGYELFRRVPLTYSGMGVLGTFPLSVRLAAARFATLSRAEVARTKAREIATTNPGLIGTYFRFRRLVSDDDLLRLGVNSDHLGLSEDFQNLACNYAGSFLASDPVASIGRLELAFYVKNILLRDSDVFGMANSLEIRLPFLDRDLVDWALRLPGEVVAPKSGAPKHLLRAMCAGCYTELHLRQPKRGFTLPFAEWLHGPLRDPMHDRLYALRESGVLDPAGVDHIRDLFERQPNSPAWSRAWALVSLGHWLERHRAAPVAAIAHA